MKREADVLRRELRIERLRKHIEAIKSGGTVSKREMRTVMTAEELHAYEDNWTNLLEFKHDQFEEARRLKDYIDLLKIADQLDTAANRSGIQTTRNKAQSAYERALERLEELLGEDMGLEAHLDRRADFDVGGNLNLSAGDVPRVVTGRSFHKLNGGMGANMSKRDFKLDYLEAALERLLADQS